MKKYTIVMTNKLRPAAQEKIMEHCDIKLWEKEELIPQSVLFDWLKTAEGLVVSGNVRVDEELLSHAPGLKVIAQSAVGYDNIDIDACTRRGIPFGNTPGVLVETTAELAFSLLLCAARRIHDSWNFIRDGKWKSNQGIPFGVNLHGKTLGIVGMGQIGAAVAKRALSFGMKVVYYNRKRREDDQQLNARYVTFSRLLAEADCIIVLTPLSKETYRMFGREQFAMMKPTAYFVNVSRGPVVDTEALFDALRTNQIAYAALDVTDPEPLPADHPILTLPNVLITPHIGSATTETRGRMALLTADNLLAGLAGRPLPACVNEIVNYK